MNSIIDSDVIIVGAGASGIYAAAKLKEAGLSSIIVEANDVVGGRLRSQEIAPNTHIELGGQWLALRGQDRLSKLIETFGFNRLTNYSSGQSIMVKDGIRLKTDFGESTLSWLAKLDVLRFSKYLSWTLRTFSMKKPWARHDLDKISLASWLVNKLWTRESRQFFLNIFEQGLCCDLAEVSVLEGLCNAKTIGSLELFQNADHTYFKEGLQNLFLQLAQRELLEIIYRQEVISIKQDEHHVEVQTKDRRFSSRAVLVTVPLPLLHKILFEPELSQQFQKLNNSVVNGHVVKVIAVYDSHWWRNLGFSGVIVDPNGAFDLVIDSSPDPSRGVLVGLVTGPRAKRFQCLSKDELRDIFMKHLETNFGVSKLPMTFFYFDWNSHKYSSGGYSARRSMNQWIEARDCLQQPFQRVYFAGTETALEWRGYIEGALESAERQARNISLRLNAEVSSKNKL